MARRSIPASAREPLSGRCPVDTIAAYPRAYGETLAAHCHKYHKTHDAKAQRRAVEARLKERRLPQYHSSENSSSSTSIASGSQSTKNASGSSSIAIKKAIISTKVAFSRSRNGSSGPM